MLSVALSRQAVDYCLRTAKDARQSVAGVNGGMCKKFDFSGKVSNIGHGLLIPMANPGREVKATLPNEIFDNALKVKPCLANTISSLRQPGLID